MKVIVAYASLTGNTEEMAEAIAAGAREAGAEVAVRDAYDADASELDQYLPNEFIDFYEALSDLDLSGRKAIVFGSGDTSYPIFCGAVDTIEAKLKEIGAELVLPGLKVEFDPSKDQIIECKAAGWLIAGSVPAVR
ncbi:flavodoxin domain-containing protein [Paenibacillus sp. MMO-58]|uniref:flavodoxin domain-containing protein n=1 Tax=Paenibacillus sp. MMO-58 TaxID=3081290 RepID=UPI003015FB46